MIEDAGLGDSLSKIKFQFCVAEEFLIGWATEVVGGGNTRRGCEAVDGIVFEADAGGREEAMAEIAVGLEKSAVVVAVCGRARAVGEV